MTNRTHEVLTEHQSGPGGEVPPLCPARFLFKVRRLFFPHRAFRDASIRPGSESGDLYPIERTDPRPLCPRQGDAAPAARADGRRSRSARQIHSRRSGSLL